MNHLGTRELRTERLLLRRFREADAEAVCASYLNDEGFLYYAVKEATSVEQEREILRAAEARYADADYYNWLITLKDGTVIGAINLRAGDGGESLEFNYAIDGRHCNRGYMTEALAAVRDFAVNELQVRRFFGGCAAENIASKRVMEKCGLRHEGTVADGLTLKDGYHDMNVYSFVSAQER